MTKNPAPFNVNTSTSLYKYQLGRLICIYSGYCMFLLTCIYNCFTDQFCIFMLTIMNVYIFFTDTSLTSSWSRIPQESEMAVRHADESHTNISLILPSTLTIIIISLMISPLSFYLSHDKHLAVETANLLRSPSTCAIIPLLLSTTARHYHSFQFCSECFTAHDDESVVTLVSLVMITIRVMILMMMVSRPLPASDNFKQLPLRPSTNTTTTTCFTHLILLPTFNLPFLLVHLIHLLIMTMLLGSKYYFLFCHNLILQKNRKDKDTTTISEITSIFPCNSLPSSAHKSHYYGHHHFLSKGTSSNKIHTYVHSCTKILKKSHKVQEYVCTLPCMTAIFCSFQNLICL